jgi:hypothetical protein
MPDTHRANDLPSRVRPTTDRVGAGTTLSVSLEDYWRHAHQYLHEEAARGMLGGRPQRRSPPPPSRVLRTARDEEENPSRDLRPADSSRGSRTPPIPGRHAALLAASRYRARRLSSRAAGHVPAGGLEPLGRRAAPSRIGASVRSPRPTRQASTSRRKDGRAWHDEPSRR